MKRPPLAQSVRGVAATALDILETRLSLALLDLREAQAVLLKSLVFAGLGVFCLAMMLMFLAGFVVVMFWDTHRVAAILSIVGLLALSGATLGWLAYLQLRGVGALFAASRVELAKDRAMLDA